jgi:hypothetical protein
MEKEFAQTMSSSAEKFSVAVETIREKLEGKLAPFLDRLADKLSDPKLMNSVDGIIDAAGKLADFFLNHPFAGLGAVVALSITESIASAAIGGAVKEALLAVLAGKSVPGAASAVGGALGMVGAAGVGVAIAATATAAAFGEKSDEGDAATAKLRGLMGKPTSDADRIAKIAALNDAIAEGKSENLNSAGNVAKDVLLPMDRVANAVGSVFGVKDATGAEEASARRERIKIEQRYTEELQAQLLKLQATGSIASTDHPALSRDINSRTHTGP